MLPSTDDIKELQVTQEAIAECVTNVTHFDVYIEQTHGNMDKIKKQQQK